VVGVDLGRDGGGQVPADPPPQRCRGVVVGQGAFREGACHHGVGVQARSGDGGEPLGQVGRECVLPGGGCDPVQQQTPFGQSGGAAPSEADVKSALPVRGCGRQLCRAGSAPIGRVDLHSRAPYGDVAEQVVPGAGLSLTSPHRGGGHERGLADVLCQGADP